MAENQFSREKALLFGLETVKKNLFFLVGLTLFVLLINYIPFIIERFAKDQVGEYMFLINIFFLFWQMIVAMGMVRIALKFVDKEDPETKDLFSCFHLFARYFVASVIFGLIVLVGLLLLVIPGIVLGLKLQFFEYFIIDKNLGIKEAFEESDKITRGIMPDLFILVILILLINVAAALFFGIGLLVTIPLSKLAIAHVYRQLVPATPKSGPVQEPQEPVA